MAKERIRFTNEMQLLAFCDTSTHKITILWQQHYYALYDFINFFLRTLMPETINRMFPFTYTRNEISDRLSRET